jgi:hypothetical protein
LFLTNAENWFSEVKEKTKKQGAKNERVFALKAQQKIYGPTQLNRSSTQSKPLRETWEVFLCPTTKRSLGAPSFYLQIK